MNLLSVSVYLSILDISYKWNYTICGLLCQVYFFLFFKFLFYFFGCVGSLLLHASFLWLRRAGATLRCGVLACHCGGFSCGGARATGMWVSVVAACGLSSCGIRA